MSRWNLGAHHEARIDDARAARREAEAARAWGVRTPDGSWLGEKQLEGWSFLGHDLGVPCGYSIYEARRKARLGGKGFKAEKLPSHMRPLKPGRSLYVGRGVETDTHTPNGYDPRWLPVINQVLNDRDSDVRINDITYEFWDAHIGPMIDSIEDGNWPDMDSGGILKG